MLRYMGGWLLGGLAMLLVTSAQARLTIEISDGVDNALPIAIVPLAWQGSSGGPPLDVAGLIREDLQRSGRFAPLPTFQMPQLPGEIQGINFDLWRGKSTEVMLVGRMAQVGVDEFRVTVALVDVFKGPSGTGQEKLQMREGELVNVTDYILLQKEWRVKGQDLRRLAHKVSDIVYEKLLGERGAFSTRVVFVTAVDEGADKTLYQLHVADIDGYNQQPLVTSDEPLLSPSWSPDGKKVAYVSFERKRPEIYVQELATGARTRLTTFNGINSAPVWSPDGRRMAMVLSKDGNPEVYVMTLAERSLQRLTHNSAIDTEPSWSPDGQWVVFTSDRGGRPQIYRTRVSDRWTERVTFEGDYNAKAQYTPDGQNLVFVHRNQGQFHIAKQAVGQDAVVILSDTQLDESPSIAPNGTMIIYATQYRGRGVLGAVSIDGRFKLRLPAAQGDVREPAWSPFLQ